MIADEKDYYNLTQEDIRGLEQAIISYTNNSFELMRKQIIRIESYRILIEEMFNVFSENNSIFITGSEMIPEGVYFVSNISRQYTYNDIIQKNEWYGAVDFYKTQNMTNRFIEDPLNAYICLIDYPADVIAGAKNILSILNKQREITKSIDYNPLVKSESIGRMSRTYITDSDKSNLIYGVDASLFSFLEPYRKLGWD